VKKNINNKNINNNNKSNNNNNLINKEFNQYKKNTIIINDTSNNNSTVINFIEIKNNYESNKNKNNDNIITNKNQIWNINISNNNNINLINNEKAEKEYITSIPDDGTVNRISTTLSPNKTITDINSQEILLKTERNYIENKESINKINGDKNDIEIDLKNNNNIKSEENKLDVNLILNTSRSIIQRRTTKKKGYKGDIDRNYKIGFIKNYDPDDCALNLSKDLKCGCSGNVDNVCFIF
jgi:hypothetical protein